MFQPHPINTVLDWEHRQEALARSSQRGEHCANNLAPVQNCSCPEERVSLLTRLLRLLRRPRQPEAYQPRYSQECCAETQAG